MKGAHILPATSLRKPFGPLFWELATWKERLHVMVQTATDAVILWDESETILFWNKGAHTMFGYSEADVIGRPVNLIFPHRYHKAHAYGMAQLDREEGGQDPVKTLQLHGLRMNGEEFPIEMSPSKSIIEHETIYCGMIRDITERRQAESALKERNRLLIFEAEIGDVLNQPQEPENILQQCVEAIVRHINAAWVGIWTLQTQREGLQLQAHGGSWCPVPEGESLQGFGQKHIGKMAYEQQPIFTNSALEDTRVPIPCWAKSGECVAFAGYPLLTKQEVVGVVAMFSREPLSGFTLHTLGGVADRIAAMMKAQNVMKDHRRLAKQNELILASTGEGIFGLNIEGHVTFVNPAGANMLGYGERELVGEPMHEMIHHTQSDGSAYPGEICPIQAALKQGLIHHQDTEVLWRKDGTSFPVDYYISPIWENGMLIGAVVVFRDISERLRLTAELLEETQLAGVTRMLGDIGHDIKNMLMPVLNGAKLLDEELQGCFANLPGMTPAQIEGTRQYSKDAIDMIVNNARRIQGRMREIADTVKGISSPLRFTMCRVSDVVHGVFEVLRFYAAEREVSLDAQGLDELPPIRADENRLFNALYNLVNNAIPEISGAGSVTVKGETDPRGNSIVISVIDTGQGMPPEIRNALFTKGAISGKAGGTGLGTKIVKDVVDAHSGTITVDSEAGQGTVFTIHLPIDGGHPPSSQTKTAR